MTEQANAETLPETTTTKPTPPGVAALAAVVEDLGPVETARRVGVPRSTLESWAKGKRNPKPSQRKKLLTRLGVSWASGKVSNVTTPTTTPTKASAPAPPTPTTPRGSSLAKLEGLETELEAAAADPQLGLRDRVTLLSERAKLASRIATLRGETGPALTWARLKKEPIVKLLEETLEEALGPWPDAMMAAGEALEALGTKMRTT